jgi:hypothetical protein
MKFLDQIKNRLKCLKENRKGEMAQFAIGGVLSFIVVGVILYIMFPILGGVSAATVIADNGNSTLAGSRGNVTNSIASGATLTGIVEIVIAAVVILGVLMIGLVKRA